MYYNFPSFSTLLYDTLLYALRFSFLRKSKLVARKQGRCAEKASAQLFRIADFGLRVFWFSFSIRIPQSAFRNLDARPIQERLMVLARNALASGPGKA